MKYLYTFHLGICLILVIIVNPVNLYAQGTSSFIGDRENLGIYGGPASDLTFSGSNSRIFAAVESPFTLLYSDDEGTNWQQAFPIDSMEFALGNRGWGGGSNRVLTNQKGWVAAITGLTVPYSAIAISYDNGNTFKTAFDPYLIKKATGDAGETTAVGLSDHFCFAAFSKHIVKLNDTLPGEIILNINDLPGTTAATSIQWITPSNDSTGFPYYLITREPSQSTRLYVIYDGITFELIPPAANQQFQNIFTHPVQISGDTVFASALDTLTNLWYCYRSFSGGFSWTDITPALNPSTPLHDVDYSPVWEDLNPGSAGLRLSFEGGLLSDDLGDTWQGPGPELLQTGIATHPLDLNWIFGSTRVGVAQSINGIAGPFDNTANIGFAGLTINDFSESLGIFYVATSSGLAYTEEYFNPLINGYDQWIPPNGLFPVPNVIGNIGITSVAIDPNNPDHVICGYDNGFYVTFGGAGNFIPVTPPTWNANPHLDPFVTDILFVNSSIVLAVTGQKLEPMPFTPPQSIGNIWRSNDGGLSWDLVTPLFPEEFVMGNCLAAGFNLPQTILYSGTGYQSPGANSVPGALWASLDLGNSWIKINDGPTNGSGIPQPIYDLDVDPGNNELVWISAGEVFARTDDGGNSFFIADVPGNLGLFSSSLIDPVFPDSIVITAGRHLLKYSFLIDDADQKFKGLPGEFFRASSQGSVLGGSNTGGSIIVEAPTHFLNLKVYIEGAFNGSELNTTLNTAGFIPLTQPFNVAPWFYNGTEHVSAIPNPDVVDWILIDLRKTDGAPPTATAETRFDRKAAFLMKDGTIRDDDGVTQPRFNIIFGNTEGSEKVHGVVYSPGHSGVRTADSLIQAKSFTFSYDFTTDPDAVFGGALSHKEISPGIWGMYSGDGNGDNQVDNTDKNVIWVNQQGNTGYYSADFNRDGNVDFTDLNNYWKPNAGQGSKID